MALRRVQYRQRLLFGLDDVGNTCLAFDLGTELYQWPQAHRPQGIVAFRRFNILGKSSNDVIDLLTGCRPVLGQQGCIDAFDGCDQADSLMDEAIRTWGFEDVVHTP